MVSDKELLVDLKTILDSDEFMIDTEPITIDDSLCVRCLNNQYGYCVGYNMVLPFCKEICAKFRKRR